MIKTINILIVDDEEPIAIGISNELKNIALIKNYSFNIYIKYSVHSAKVLLKKVDIDIFFIDYDFKGGQDGYSLIEFLNNKYINKFIILMTSKDDFFLNNVIETCNKESKNNKCSFETKPLKPLKLSSLCLDFIKYFKEKNIKDRSINIFLSHSSEDKTTIAIPLFEYLHTYSDLRVWIDIEEIKESNGVVNRVNDGLQKAKYGIIVMSLSYLNNESWAKKELEILTKRHIEEKIPLFIIEILRYNLILKWKSSKINF